MGHLHIKTILQSCLLPQVGITVLINLTSYFMVLCFFLFHFKLQVCFEMNIQSKSLENNQFCPQLLATLSRYNAKE